MGRQDDWYRSDAWDAEARALFEAKLARARSSRPQYLRIKALALVDSGDAERVEAGRALLERLIEEYSGADQPWDVAGAHVTLADSFRDERKLAEAEQHLRAALDVQEGRNIDWWADLRLAEVLIERDATAHRDEAWALLDAAAKHVTFQNHTWRIEIARARLLARTRDTTGAARHARTALALLDHNEPRFARHPGLGFIKPDPSTVAELTALATGDGRSE